MRTTIEANEWGPHAEVERGQHSDDRRSQRHRGHLPPQVVVFLSKVNSDKSRVYWLLLSQVPSQTDFALRVSEHCKRSAHLTFGFAYLGIIYNRTFVIG